MRQVCHRVHQQVQALGQRFDFVEAALIALLKSSLESVLSPLLKAFLSAQGQTLLAALLKTLLKSAQEQVLRRCFSRCHGRRPGEFWRRVVRHRGVNHRCMRRRVKGGRGPVLHHKAYFRSPWWHLLCPIGRATTRFGLPTGALCERWHAVAAELPAPAPAASHPSAPADWMTWFSSCWQ